MDEIKQPEEDQENAVWGVVANVVHEHLFGEGRELLKGTKHFAPGAKVFCVRFRDDLEKPTVEVVGRHRKSQRQIKVWMRVAHLANFRVELVYSPSVIRSLTNYSYDLHHYFDGRLSEKIYLTWDGSEDSKRKAEEIVNGPLIEKFGAGTQPFIRREKDAGEASQTG